METCDVVIVGGGPAGSSCAWQLRRAGRDVLVMDAASFPRDKVCAGWITPQVVEELDLDLDGYRAGRTLQPIDGFRTGLIGGSDDLETHYERIVSYGIRRSEFDQYLLQRSGARLRLGVPVASIRRAPDGWIVNDEVRADILVGAGGHFCPVASAFAAPPGRPDERSLVVAQETEFRIPEGDRPAFTTTPSMPELYFARDLTGYGWCFRKQDHVNVGFGSLDRRRLPESTRAFVAFLRSRGTIPDGATWRWRGHAYLLAEPPSRPTFGERLVLAGDAAGLAYSQSGEGIRPAIESGLMAASAILAAGAEPTAERLAPYDAALRARFGSGAAARLLSRTIPERLAERVAPSLFRSPWFVRHVLIDRWFLHAA